MRVLVSVKAGSLGHLLPLVPLARAARAADHDVIFASGPDRKADVEGLGFELVPCGLPFVDALAERRRRWPDWPWGGDLVHTFSKVFTMVQAPAALDDLGRAVEEWRPDVVVCEPSEFAAPAVAAARSLPLVVHGWGLPLPAELVLAAGAAAAPMWEAHGLVPSPTGGMAEGIRIDLCPASLDPGDGLASTGPVLPMSPCVVDQRAGEREGRRLAYVTLGTAMFARDNPVLPVAARALAGTGLDVVVTVGPYGDPEAVTRVAPDARVERFIDQTEVLVDSALSVCHGGSGTVLGALAHGVPLVVIAHGADQHRNAEAVARVGAGIAVDTPDEPTIGAAVRAVLDDPSYRVAAAAMSAEIGAMPTPTDAWAALTEQLVSR